MNPEREPDTFLPLAGAPVFDVDEIHRRIARRFKIYEVESAIRGIPGADMAAFYVQTDPATLSQQFEELRQEFRQYDPSLVLILQRKMGEDIILVARKPTVKHRGPALNIALLLLTIATTTISGALFFAEYDRAEKLLMIGNLDASFLHWRILVFGFLTFSLPLIFILGIHELGHYFVARRHEVHTSLPYFIPVPPVVPIGTFGAFISIRDPIPNRKALFDIGASGPIAGFLVAIPVIILGMVLTAVVGVPVPPEPELHATLQAPEGSRSWGYGVETLVDEYAKGNRTRGRDTVYFEEIRLDLSAYYPPPDSVPNGTWNLTLQGLHLDDESTATLRVSYGAGPNASTSSDFVMDGENYTAQLERGLAEEQTEAHFEFRLPPNATRLSAGFEWKEPPSPFVKLGNSLFFIGIQWTINRFVPLDQNVLTHPLGLAGWVGLLVTGFNLLPAGQLDGGHVARAVLGDRTRWAAYAAVALMFLLSLRFAGWLVIAVLIVLLGVRHPPPLNDMSPLDTRRKVLAAFILILLIVTFVPFPFVSS